ncbi:siderophore biosynthetic enzyme FrgA [Legionella beliardensis]|uniref:Siderophore biosynthetic enzyme FrgA n=1 Tax=Legionella beliardensis TaxID=91822 RepID=A0A378I4I4_9GAMM|nr:IucA/IucC family protein [Legionella beliardensis]STX30098.1 siderophore biosynthetic enzyme FrgA [Legionella beliardensis]
MALAYNQFEELSHQLRFLLFEIGIGLPSHAVNNVIDKAHQDCLVRLQQAALREKLIEKPLYSYHISDFIDQLQLRLKILKSESRFYRWDLLRQELNESIANEAMALIYRQRWQKELAMQLQGTSSFWAWLKQQDSKSTLPFLEQWSCVGHPYHPNFRAKMGLSRREVLQYSPEFNAQVSLHWCALHQEKIQVNSINQTYLELMSCLFPAEYVTWQHKLQLQQLNPNDFYPIPVHPWQWRNQLQIPLASLIDRKQLILIPHHQLTQPSMSLRTMIPITQHLNHLKLAMAVHTTSATRTVSPASAQNGPAISAWLTQILKTHQHYNDTLFLARDLAGAHLQEPTLASGLHKQLAFILRESPLQYVQDNQQLIPLAGLFVNSPLSNEPLLLDIIRASGINPEQYFKHYCHCVIKGQLHLLLHYGVALEAHQQNTLIVFENNLPKSLIIRDLGGIYLCNHADFQDKARPSLHPESTIITSNLADTCNKFIHGNLQSNLAYWINSLSQFKDLTPASLWHIVFNTIQAELSNLAPAIKPSVLDWYQQHLLQKPWQHKSLLLMRLVPSKKHNHLTLTANPLSSFDV